MHFLYKFYVSSVRMQVEVNGLMSDMRYRALLFAPKIFAFAFTF